MSGAKGKLTLNGGEVRTIIGKENVMNLVCDEIG